MAGGRGGSHREFTNDIDCLTQRRSSIWEKIKGNVRILRRRQLSSSGGARSGSGRPGRSLCDVTQIPLVALAVGFGPFRESQLVLGW